MEGNAPRAHPSATASHVEPTGVEAFAAVAGLDKHASPGSASAARRNARGINAARMAAVGLAERARRARRVSVAHVPAARSAPDSNAAPMAAAAVAALAAPGRSVPAACAPLAARSISLAVLADVARVAARARRPAFPPEALVAVRPSVPPTAARTAARPPNPAARERAPRRRWCVRATRVHPVVVPGRLAARETPATAGSTAGAGRANAAFSPRGPVSPPTSR